jgi:predicted CoA-binding protein
MYVFRIHIRPEGGSADMPTTFNYCLKNGILGVGWRTNSNRSTKDWDKYFNEASQKHPNLQVCKYIKKWVSEGDLVWTRNAEGQYYLARVISGWEYWTSQEAIDKDIDIANVFRVVLKPVDIDAVPGKIVACFRASRSIQEVADEKAHEYSKYLWNILSNKQVYQIDKSEFSDIFMMLDDEETEDLVFLYLQSHGWYVLPNSRKGDSMSFEYLAVNPMTGEKALTQVKTGQVTINKDDYVRYSEKIFLFQSNELFTGVGATNVVCISRDELLKFLRKSLAWFPKSFQTKVGLVSQ